MAIAEEVDGQAEYDMQFSEACALHPGITRVSQSTYNNIFNSLKPCERGMLELPHGFEGLVTPKGKLVVDYYSQPTPEVLSSIGVAMTFLSFVGHEAKAYRRPRVVAGTKARAWLEGLKPESFRDDPATFNGIVIESGDVADDVILLIPHEIGRVVKMCSGPDRTQEVMDFIVPQNELARA
jgi:hypothetical protein